MKKSENNDIRKNGSVVEDPTAYETIKKVDGESKKNDRSRGDDDYKRFNDLLDVIFTICELSDFHIEERIVVKDKKTGKVWR